MKQITSADKLLGKNKAWACPVMTVVNGPGAKGRVKKPYWLSVSVIAGLRNETEAIPARNF